MRPPLARTTTEARLYLDLRPCDSCGGRGFQGRRSVVFVDGELCGRHSGPCPECGTVRTFTFRIPDNPGLPPADDVVFGGAEPSELLDPGQWLDVADRAATDAHDDGDYLLAAAALDEVVKFIPAGADEVPADALWTAHGRDVYHRMPGRFRRRRLEAVAATYRVEAARTRGEDVPDPDLSPARGVAPVSRSAPPPSPTGPDRPE